jgi:phosphoribosylpyrophosphate synthetase
MVMWRTVPRLLGTCRAYNGKGSIMRYCITITAARADLAQRAEIAALLGMAGYARQAVTTWTLTAYTATALADALTVYADVAALLPSVAVAATVLPC